MTAQRSTKAKPVVTPALVELEEAVDPETDSPDPVPDVVEPGRHFIAVRRMTYQGQVLEAGDPVPGAENWPRVDAWVRARYLKEV